MRLLRVAALVLTAISLACASAPEHPPVPPLPEPAPVAKAVPADEGGPIPISAGDPVFGDRNALVTIVEFGDFQCPFCGKADRVMQQVAQTYGPDKVRIVWKHMPLDFHPEAAGAADAAAAVMMVGGANAFAKFRDLAFANQRALGRSVYPEWARAAGVDPAKMQAAIDDGRAHAKVEADLALARTVHVEGTPEFFVNGARVTGAQPMETFKAAIDVEIAKARVKLASGTAPADLYVALATDNFPKLGAPEPPPEREEEKPDTNIYKIALGKSPLRGSKTAPVTVVVFSDFQCPFCKRAEKTLDDLRAKYGDDVRFVWKNLPLPFHKRAEPAAQLALEARAQKGDAGFWAAHDKLFESSPKLEDDDLVRIAGELQLDIAKAKRAIEKHTYKAAIDADTELAESFTAEGTPHFFINGRRLVGAQPLPEFVTVVDAELARARAAIAAGATPASVYDSVTKDGVGPKAPDSKTLDVPRGAPSLGAAGAPVVIHVFSDFQCPFCARVEPTLEQLRKDYGTKIRFVWHNLPLPFHQYAAGAAEAAVEAQAQKGDAGFWKMHDALFAAQGVSEGLSRTGLEAVAGLVGLDMKRFNDALDANKHKARVDAEVSAANAGGISGTPGFIITSTSPTKAKSADQETITGYVVSGAQRVERFKRLIDRALAERAANKGKKP